MAFLALVVYFCLIRRLNRSALEVQLSRGRRSTVSTCEMQRMASTTGQTVRTDLALSCLPCITLGQTPTSRHTHSLTPTGFSTMAVQCGVLFLKATKFGPFLGRLSRAGLLKSIWTQVSSADNQQTFVRVLGSGVVSSISQR